MDFVETEDLNPEEKKHLLFLWNTEYPEELAHSEIGDLQKYLSKLKTPRHLLLKDNTGTLKAWYCDFLRKDQRWFAMILHRDLQGKGIGTKILTKAKTSRSLLKGWVIKDNTYKRADGQTYPSPAGFYIKNGFQIFPKIELPAKNFSAVKMEWKKPV